MTAINPSNENEAKSDVFPWDIFKSDVISFLSKNIKVSQSLSKSQLISFMIKVKPSQTEKKQSQTFVRGTNSNLTSFFISHKILKYFNDFYYWHL